MDHISKAAVSLKTSEDLHDFHGRALSAVIQSHPHGSKRLLTALANQLQMEGTVRMARQKDATDVGQIIELSPKSIDVKPRRDRS